MIYSVEPNQKMNYLLQSIDYPWPLHNRWLLFRQDHLLDPLSPTFRSDFLMIAGQLARVEGHWLIEPIPGNPDRSRATYSFIGDPGFQTPHFIAKMICTGQVRSVVEAFRKKVEVLLTPNLNPH